MNTIEIKRVNFLSAFKYIYDFFKEVLTFKKEYIIFIGFIFFLNILNYTLNANSKENTILMFLTSFFGLFLYSINFNFLNFFKGNNIKYFLKKHLKLKLYLFSILSTFFIILPLIFFPSSDDLFGLSNNSQAEMNNNIIKYLQENIFHIIIITILCMLNFVLSIYWFYVYAILSNYTRLFKSLKTAFLGFIYSLFSLIPLFIYAGLFIYLTETFVYIYLNIYIETFISSLFQVSLYYVLYNIIKNTFKDLNNVDL